MTRQRDRAPLDPSKRRFFIALVPPQDIQDYARKIQQSFVETYHSRKALNSPPHITLQAPFEWQLDNVAVLEQSLKTFASTKTPVPVTLKGFGAFAPRVIYINVLRTPELLALQSDLIRHMEASCGIVDPVSKTRPFSPHITVAYRDLTKPNFRAAWPEFQNRPLEFEFTGLKFEFTVSQLTLLIHDGKRWNIHSEFPTLAESL